jgi:nitroimidazol reductase NimA-like FMN-containing flavoprotein (pyridoxamine 5'-phosphate oxidase superfamily)
MTGVLHPDEIEAVLHRHHVGRVACVAGGRPYVVPITYAYADGAVYGQTLPGKKVDAMRAQPLVCFEVDERWDDTTWRSVVADGVYEELTDAQERGAALHLLRGALPDTVRIASSGDQEIVFRLRLLEKTGRFVMRSAPLQIDEAPGPLLHGLDLRDGDERNWPGRLNDA